MKYNLGRLRRLISKIEKYQNQLELKEQLQEAHDNFKEATNKINNSGQLIDFFVHDMLDFAVLKNKKKNFTKNI